MSAQAIGQKLVDLVRQFKFEEIHSTVYSPDIVSIEVGDEPAETVGLEAVAGKAEWWQTNYETHGLEVEGPFPNGDEFAVYFSWDVTHKESGNRFHMKEVGLYKVAGDRVIREKFFYQPF